MKFLKTITAVLCCLTMTTLFTACKSDDEMKALLVGTWKGINTQFTDVLKLNEDGSFTFESHIPRYLGSGTYTYESDPEDDDFLTLKYEARAAAIMKIKKLTDNTLELSESSGIYFHFTKVMNE